jgi:hypothetical protein
MHELGGERMGRGPYAGLRFGAPEMRRRLIEHQAEPQTAQSGAPSANRETSC